MAYDSFGNIKSKSDIGAYSYNANNAGPHALTDVNGSALTYDPNGNNTGTVGGRQITYNTFDKPTLIARSGYTSSFTYGPNRDYYKRIDGPSGTKTLYLDGVEKVYKTDGSYDVRRYVPGGALITQKYNSGGALQSTSKELILKDHLGSIDAIADSAGALKQAMSFDSWGRRRDATTWAAVGTTVGFDTSRTAKGYTGHEMLDDVNVVHMHGRIYDARWGRMLQADPYIQDGSDSQAFNRFAYVNNNPLIHTDPSGFTIWDIFSGGSGSRSEQQMFRMAQASGSFGCSGACGGIGSVTGGASVGVSGAATVNATSVSLRNTGLDGSPATSSMGVGAKDLENSPSAVKRVGGVDQVIVKAGASTADNSFFEAALDYKAWNRALFNSGSRATISHNGWSTYNGNIIEDVTICATCGDLNDFIGERGITPLYPELLIAGPENLIAAGGVKLAAPLLKTMAPWFKAAPVAAKEATTVIGRVKDLKSLQAGEKSLLDRLPDLGSPKANWRQNSGILRSEMNRGLPIRDASPGDEAGQFLNAERNLLRDRGWTFDSKTNF